VKQIRIFILVFLFLPFSGLASDYYAEHQTPGAFLANALNAPFESINAALRTVQDGGDPISALQAAGNQAIAAQGVLYAFSASGYGKYMKPVLTAAGWFLLVFGYTTAIFLPAIPLIFWIMGICYWLIMAFAGCASAVFYMLFYFSESRIKKTNGQMLLLFVDSMIRPSLMVIGYILGLSASKALFQVLFMIMIPVLLSFDAQSIIGIAGKLGALLVLARLSLSIVLVGFSLVQLLPSFAINFLGGSLKKINVG